MSRSSREGRAAKVLFTIFSFLLSMLIFFFTLLIILQSTFLNKNFILNVINDSNYYSDLSTEITEELIGLGNASGINEEFFADAVDELMIRNDVSQYVKSFYSGKDIKVDTATFKQHLTDELDKYIAKNNLTVSKDAQNGINTFIKEAADVYSSRIEFPYLGLVAGYFHKLLTPVFYVTIGAGILILLIAVIIIATNRWKHRAYRYLSYSLIASVLMTLVVPVAAYLFNKLDKLAIMSRALFNLYYTCATSFLNSFFIAAAVLALLSALLIFLHGKSRKHAING